MIPESRLLGWAVVGSILAPMAAALVAYLWPRRSQHFGLAGVFAAAGAAAMVALGVWRLGPQRYRLGGFGAPLGIELYVDGLAALMVAMTAAVGVAVSVYATSYVRPPDQRRFWPLWLLLLTALDALFLTADAFNAYVSLELLGLASIGLVALAGTPGAITGAMRYLLVSLFGSLTYLLGVALLYGSYGTLDLTLLGARIEPGPAVWSAISLVSLGLLLKTALLPFHLWLPPAHASAPVPASAALSALVVKASLYLLLRLWFGPLSIALTTWAAPLLGMLGTAAIVWGGLRALSAERLKRLIAYSTVAQIGTLFLAFPLYRDSPVAARAGVLYLMVAHALAKGGAFLAAGALQSAAGSGRMNRLRGVAPALPVSVFAFALAGISLAGLPPSGGFVGKWLLLEAALTGGQWWWAAPLLAGSLLAAAYALRVIALAFAPQEPGAEVADRVGATPQWSALSLAASAVLLGFVGTGLLGLAGVGAEGAL